MCNPCPFPSRCRDYCGDSCAFLLGTHLPTMSLQPGIAPRRLLQTHGAFINTTLANRLRLRRRFSEGEPVKPYTPAGIADDSVEGRRTAQAYEVTSNDEVFDAREGEIMVSSTDLTGFPNSRRAAVFSSLNGWKAPYPDARDALHASDFNFVGLCQNGFVSSNTALQSQVSRLPAIKHNVCLTFLLLFLCSRRPLLRHAALLCSRSHRE